MDTSKNAVENILDFESFIKKFFPEYQFDTNNGKVIKQLGLWAIRSEHFNKPNEGLHIDRGILLTGPVGVGKDELFRLLRSYLSYLRSPYGYTSKVVWKFAAPFMKDGYSCFQEETGNRYYEELALTDENTGKATREYVKHYGNELLIGAEIIHIRYKVFKEYGLQTHFSTNLNEAELEGVYGARCISRLKEMCNFIVLLGKDRRGIVAPVFLKNKNQPVAPRARETTVDEHMENKKMLENGYTEFCATGAVTNLCFLHYNLLKVYGCNVATEEEMQILMEKAAESFKEDVGLKKVSTTDRENNKRTFAWNTARKMAVEKYYAMLKLAGAKTIFDIVSVDISQVVPHSTPTADPQINHKE